MTFEQFQASKHWHNDLREAVPTEVWGDDHWPPHGYLYLRSLYIEGINEHWPEATQKAGRWYLLLGNSEYITDDLETLERRLYEYAVGEGMA